MSIKLPLPLCIQFPLTDACNLKCIGCPRQNEVLNLKNSFLSTRVLEHIVKNFKKFESPFSLLPIWLGEPFLHPQIEQILDFLAESLFKNHFFSGMIIHTNGVFFKYEYLKKWIEYELPLEVVFSLDASNKKEYFYVKGKNFYDRVVNNIKKFLDYLSFFPKNNIKVSIQFLVFKVNWRSVGEFIAYWENQFKLRNLNSVVVYNPYSKIFSQEKYKIIIRRVESDFKNQGKYELLHRLSLERAGILKETISRKDKKRIIDIASSQEKDNRRICPAPFKFILIDSKGDIFFCWKDKNRELKIGNIQENDLSYLFSSQKYLEFLRSHLRKNLVKYPKCKNCNGFDIAPLSKEEISKIREFLCGI